MTRIAALAMALTVSGGPVADLPIIGGVTDSGRGAAIVRLQVRRPLTDRLDLTAAAVPLELAFGQPGARTIYGAGLDPLGVSLRLGPAYVAASGGVRLFARPVPIQQGQRFNFVADLEAGVRFGRAAVGLNFHHVSNGGLGGRNPGANYLLLSLRVRK